MKQKKRIVVISLGGSVIASEKIDIKFLESFKKTIKKKSKKFKFIIVCGGGETARKYIHALSQANATKKIQSYIGIEATRLNAKFVSYLFYKNPNEKVPVTFKELKNFIKKKNIIICGALEYKPEQTSDSTAAEIAKELKGSFINVTNVTGLFDKDPRKYRNTRLIKETSWKDFYRKANKINFKPGEHFVLDQTAAKIIMKNKIKTYIVGKDTRQLDLLLDEKKFKGTIIGS